MKPRNQSCFYGKTAAVALCLLLSPLSTVPGADRPADIDEDDQTIIHPHIINPGYNETTRGDLPDKEKEWHIEAQLDHSSGMLRNPNVSGDLLGNFSTGSLSVFEKEYTPGVSTTGYSGHFYGDIVPDSAGGSGGPSGPPPNHRFDAYAKGGIDSFTVTPEEAIVPVPAGSTETTTFTAGTNAKWTWRQTMPGSSSAEDTSGSNATYDAYCTHAGSYTLQAEKHDDDKITALAEYIPTGVQRLSAVEDGNPDNYAETVWPTSTTPITAGDQPDDIETGVLYVPYTEDENGQSTTSVTLRATPYPTSEFPDDENIPDWTLLDADGNVIDDLADPEDPGTNDYYPDFDGQAKPTAFFMPPSPGKYALRTECGNKLEMQIVAIQTKFDPATVALYIGGTYELGVTVIPEQGTAVLNFSSSDTNILEVSGSAPELLLTGINAGKATVKAIHENSTLAETEVIVGDRLSGIVETMYLLPEDNSTVATGENIEHAGVYRVEANLRNGAPDTLITRTVNLHGANFDFTVSDNFTLTANNPSYTEQGPASILSRYFEDDVGQQKGTITAEMKTNDPNNWMISSSDSNCFFVETENP